MRSCNKQDPYQKGYARDRQAFVPETFRLFDDTLSAIVRLNELGFRQSVLSAMAQDQLGRQMEAFRLRDYFEDIIGLSDIYASSNVSNALNYVNTNKINPSTITLVGDTAHDYEVAQTLGYTCILIANGYQDLSRSACSKALTLADIKHVPEALQTYDSSNSLATRN